MSSPASEHFGHNLTRFGQAGRAAAARVRVNNNNRSQEDEEKKEEGDTADEYDGLFGGNGNGGVGEVGPMLEALAQAADHEVGEVPFGAGDAAGRPEEPPPEEK